MGHEHAHEEHGHDVAHDHHTAPKDAGRAFMLGIAINLGFVVVEVVYGVLAHSMALVADAGHNLSDVLGLTFSLGATVLARRKPSSTRTYGFRKSTLLASLTNAVLLLAVTGGVLWESVRRLGSLAPVGGKTVIVVAIAGVVVNGASALLFLRGDDLNAKSAFLHLASDAVLAFGVAIAGAVVLYTNWVWLDPVVSIVLSLIILATTWSLLRKSVNLVLDAVPEGIDLQTVRRYLESVAAVLAVHDLHIWAMSTTETALTAHLVTSDGQ